jgi:hypothetical protein
MADTFWVTIAEQLKELESARTADDVLRILSPERNPYGPAAAASMTAGGAEGFFAGSGGDGTVWDALDDAGWTESWAESGIYYTMRAPDGTEITYVEGDIYRGRH